jgi:hypothetical protein
MEFKKGILSADGARRLVVPHLAGSQVDYELNHHKRIGAYAGEIYHQGTRLGWGMTLGRNGIIPSLDEDPNAPELEGETEVSSCDARISAGQASDSVEENIERFVKEHGIGGYIHEIANTSALFAGDRSRCFEMRLERLGVSADLHVYVGLAIRKMKVEDALRHLAEVAESYGGEPDFATWNDQNDEGYCEQLLGREVAEGLYRYYRETYERLVKVLGENLHQELANIVTR